MKERLVATFGLAICTLAASGLQTPAPASAQEPTAARRKVSKTDAEWAKVLTRDQYLVTRQKATEPAFSGRYVSNHARGVYTCVCCGAELFGSQAKFDSGTGWPSFDRPLDPRRIEQAQDNELAEPRVEVMCRDCGAHLGHVFPDGPTQTGLRYCINSVSLRFKSAVPGGSTKSRASGRAKSKAAGKTGERSAETAPDTQSPESKPAETGKPDPQAPASGKKE